MTDRPPKPRQRLVIEFPSRIQPPTLCDLPWLKDDIALDSLGLSDDFSQELREFDEEPDKSLDLVLSLLSPNDLTEHPTPPKEPRWPGICRALNVEPVIELDDEQLDLYIDDIDQVTLRGTIEIFGLQAATNETLMKVSLCHGGDFLLSLPTVEEFFLNMIPVARYWESVPAQQEATWSFTDKGFALVKNNLLDAPFEMPGFWAPLYTGKTEHYFDASTVPVDVDSSTRYEASLIRFIQAWVLRLCQENYDLTQKVVTENLGVILRATFARTLPLARANSQLNKQLNTIRGDRCAETPFTLFLIPLLKSQHALFIAKECFLDALFGKRISQKIEDLAEAVWAMHLMHSPHGMLIIESVVGFKQIDIPGLAEYLGDYGTELGLTSPSSSRKTPFKIMSLPKSIVKEVTDLTDEVQTYLQLSEASVLDKLKALDVRFPNFTEVTEHVRKKLLFAVKLKKPFQMSPVVIKGPSGIGKTFYLKQLKEVLDLPAINLHAAQITCGSALAGLQSTWGTGQPGALSKHLAKHQVANSLVIFDELSQLKDNTTSNGLNPTAVLLQALDKNESKEFVDAYTREKIDISKFSWFFTANHLNNLDSFLLTRLTVFAVEPMKQYKNRSTIDDLLAQALENLDLPSTMAQPLDDLGCKVVLDYLNGGGNLRSLLTALENMITEAFEAPQANERTVVVINAPALRRHL
jgi:hypothetical protein